jgi:hypothetical protein
MDKDQRRNLPKKKEKQKLPRLERLLSPILEWDDWTAAHIVVFTRVGLLVKEKRLRPPIEVNLTSGNDELLISYRLDADPECWP